MNFLRVPCTEALVDEFSGCFVYWYKLLARNRVPCQPYRPLSAPICPIGPVGPISPYWLLRTPLALADPIGPHRSYLPYRPR